MLTQKRSDDNEEVFLNRIKVYKEVTKSVKEYYQKNGKLVLLNSEQIPEEIVEQAIKLSCFDK